ncbi:MULTISPECIES: hypothetical protein [Streptomyces]|uniref:Uncharacterized protein n=1 Tax=Streptomyces flavovirens TaxID=52258 RepID=A0ABV8N277_9ACTN|nr:hypothetical protein [Streptomyces sp. MBT51]MBK3596396.1 hypothetical protein [Streptomyces sp. MBT51]
MPHPPYYLDTGYTKVGADKVTDSARIKILDEAARDRYLAIQRDNLAADWKAETGAAHAAQRTPESAAAWQQATDAYKESHAAMGDAAEKFGEKAAEYHHSPRIIPSSKSEPYSARRMAMTSSISYDSRRRPRSRSRGQE